MTIFGGLLLYSGLIACAIGLISVLNPLRFLHIRNRRVGLVVFGTGVLAFLGGVYLPIAETRVGESETRLDDFVPEYQFSEFHSTVVNASKARVYSAIWAVTPEQVRYFQVLMRIRFLKPPPAQEPILQNFVKGGFLLLSADPGAEIVIGRVGTGRGSLKLTPEQFRAFQANPAIKIGMNFRIREIDASHCLLTTETRVYASGSQVRRGFATYWRMIYPGSSLIRRMWLRAIKQSAEAPSTAAT